MSARLFTAKLDVGNVMAIEIEIRAASVMPLAKTSYSE
jgi:hypothetical protein